MAWICPNCPAERKDVNGQTCIEHDDLLIETASELRFETFDTPRIAVFLQPVLSLYASGRTTGAETMDVGHLVPGLILLADNGKLNLI